MTALIVVNCIITPYSLAFSDSYSSSNMEVFDLFMDLMFMIDIIINFFTAFYDDFLELIDNPKVMC